MHASVKAQEIAQWLFETFDGDVRLAIPLGLGKAESLVNALYARAKRDPATSLHIYTALTLEVPVHSTELEQRFFDPRQQDLFRNVPDYRYADDLRAGSMPDNVKVTEFFLRPGAWLNQSVVQQNYTSSNYTHVARDLAARNVNVIAQLVAREIDNSGNTRYSLSCNPDITLDLRDQIRAQSGSEPKFIGEISDALPFMEGDAALWAGDFDAIVEPDKQRDLFPVPNEIVGLAEHAIALRTATVIKDGGTIQIGIGGLGDAVAHAIAMRHVDNKHFIKLTDALGVAGDRSPFTHGLYGASEMFVEGFLELRQTGVLTRTIRNGTYLHGGFFLGSRRFYKNLKLMKRIDRDGIKMSRISFINDLLGDETRKRKERVHGRFINAAMMVTLSGAVVSDGLEDGRVVSGVGGQFNFVSMAHELCDGRSIIILPATRERFGKVTSNIVWNYGHTTIPRHLRDMVITEYGVADLRGASDAEVIARLLSITDSRFQEALRQTAIEAGKLPGDFKLEAATQQNTPENLAERLTRSGSMSRLPYFPLGTDFSEVEAGLAVALSSLRKTNWLEILYRTFAGRSLAGEQRFDAAFKRMDLIHPLGLRDHIYRALLASTLDRELYQDERPLVGPGYQTT